MCVFGGGGGGGGGFLDDDKSLDEGVSYLAEFDYAASSNSSTTLSAPTICRLSTYSNMIPLVNYTFWVMFRASSVSGEVFVYGMDSSNTTAQAISAIFPNAHYSASLNSTQPAYCFYTNGRIEWTQPQDEIWDKSQLFYALAYTPDDLAIAAGSWPFWSTSSPQVVGLASPSFTPPEPSDLQYNAYLVTIQSRVGSGHFFTQSARSNPTPTTNSDINTGPDMSAIIILSILCFILLLLAIVLVMQFCLKSKKGYSPLDSSRVDLK